jgi:gamma-glutamyl hercynylcysteine S-oxide synthase
VTTSPLLPGTAPNDLDEEVLKSYVADELARVRDRSFGLTTTVLDEPELLAQHSKLMSPLIWDLAHVGNYEELWLLRAAAGIEAMRPEIDSIYDAFEHPRAARPALPMLRPDEAGQYIGLVRRKVLDSLSTLRLSPGDALLDAGFVFGMVLQHEHQHDETMLATHQLRRGEPVLPPGDGLPAPSALITSSEVRIAAGRFEMGTSDDSWAYDNERPAHDVELPAYFIDTMPVSNRAYRAFVEEGGYDDQRWWTTAGWEWRCGSGKRTPAFWFSEGHTWMRRRFGRVEVLPDDEPVEHVCFHEADAYARWVGRRLPTESEWEKAASWDEATSTKRRFPWGSDAPTSEHANLGQQRFRPTACGSFPAGASPYGVLQMLGDVWEWTSTDFTGYPGFRSFPYKEYSEVFFDDGYKVLRGGCWATDPLAVRTTFRNWDLPIRRQIFSGFRTARDA